MLFKLWGNYHLPRTFNATNLSEPPPRSQTSASATRSFYMYTFYISETLRINQSSRKLVTDIKAVNDHWPRDQL